MSLPSAPSDPVERIATQLSLLLTNIARFDFPGRAPDLLERLLMASGETTRGHLL